METAPCEESVRIFRKNDVNVLPWLYQGHDLHPIEDVWAITKRQLEQFDTHPNTADGIYLNLYVIQNNPSTEYFDSLVKSMAKRCKAINNVRGGSKKY